MGQPSVASRCPPTSPIGPAIPERDAGKDFVESIARGIAVVRCFGVDRPLMSLSDVAEATGLARPTARRILLTLAELGYVEQIDGRHRLTPRVLELGMAYVRGQGLWDVARPHMERLVGQTRESSSVAQLDGSDIVYVARVAVAKIITFAVSIGTRFPALQTSLGKVLLADLDPDELERVLALESRSGIEPRWQPDRAERDVVLREVRARGWAVADEDLAPGIRSISAPLRGGDGRVLASLNVTVHAAETSRETLLEAHLPRLLATASAISEDLARYQSVPHVITST